MTVKKETKYNWLLILAWVVSLAVIFGLSFYEGTFLEGIASGVFFLLYLSLVIAFGIFATRVNSLNSSHPSSPLVRMFEKIFTKKRHVFFGFSVLWLLFFALGFKMFMHGYDYAPSPHSLSQRIVKSSISGLEFSTLFFLIPFLLGYLPSKAVLFYRKCRKSS